MFRRNHAVAESNAADILFAMKRVDEALARERRSLAVYEAQAKADPTNAAAQNDLAIGYSKIAQLLEAIGKPAEGLAEQQRATDIHRRLVAADPQSSDMKQELASDHNREATLQAKLGMREPSLANHARAVDISRELTDGQSERLRAALCAGHRARRARRCLRRVRARGPFRIARGRSCRGRARLHQRARHLRQAAEGRDVRRQRHGVRRQGARGRSRRSAPSVRRGDSRLEDWKLSGRIRPGRPSLFFAAAVTAVPLDQS